MYENSFLGVFLPVSTKKSVINLSKFTLSLSTYGIIYRGIPLHTLFSGWQSSLFQACMTQANTIDWNKHAGFNISTTIVQRTLSIFLDFYDAF
jgi:hypothetical protein